MTDAHERITLPPISSFDISPTGKHRSQFQAGPSRRGPHLHGSPSWDGTSVGSHHLRNELDDIPFGPGLESPRNTYHIATGRNHSPYSEPAVLVAAYESNPTAPRPRSSSAALDRGVPVVPHVSCSAFHRSMQRLTWTSSRYPQFHLASHGRKGLASYISSREPSPQSQASFSRSPTDSPNARSRLQCGTVASPHGTAVGTSVSGDRRPSQTAAFINSTLGDAQEVKSGGVSSTGRQASPARKRKASEMLGTASPGSEERAISPEPSESEAKKKYKKKMNVRHYRAQNKDAMTQLRDALPEHMRPPERQAKAYVTLSAIKYIRELTAENERLRAENIRQAKEFAEWRNNPELSSSGVVAVATGDVDDGTTVPKAEEADK
ncbi:hypothetical protein F5148DRAFT_71211 [Russula earlei]|uniref:Uncharacterized protein n=1 Tax=Russula earlei TaxID=71964 RepID=A0ACC0U9M4_9AGAM|nr:hypothetical protein F5148DRAFT_71211 [Russula earlei]